MRKKIAIIGTVGLPAKYGRFETFAEHLVLNLSSKYDFTVYCSKKEYENDGLLNEYKEAKLEYINYDSNGIQSILYNTFSIINAVKEHDVLLIIGVNGSWILPFVKFFTNKKIIVSIDKIEWKHNKWSFLAKHYFLWAEKMAIRYSHIDISDNESIQDYTAMKYRTLSRVIEYGANHTIKSEPTLIDTIRYPFLSQHYAVKVCRIEPENNVHLVLDAFQKTPNRNIVIVGNWENSDYGKRLKKAYKNLPNITLLEPIYEQREIDVIRGNANLYIHGHSNGGTNMSLIEAMYLGLPVFSFDDSFNKTTTENNAVYFSTVDELVEKLNTISNDELKEFGEKMKEIASKRYTWKSISKKYKILIKDVFSVKKKNSIYSELSKLNVEILEKYQLLHLKNSQFFYLESQI